MKLKCDDGIVREFRISYMFGDRMTDGKEAYINIPAECLECGEDFGWHDTKILKPMFKAHVCKQEAT